MQQYLNLPYFCDYIITNYYAGNTDWDGHNYSALYRPGLGFVYLDWDGEMSIYSGWNGSPYVNITGLDTSGGPTELFVQLLANSDFRQLFADRVYRDLSTVLSPTNAVASYQAEANRISTAVLDESARWGNLGELDATWGQLGTPATWNAHINSELSTCFPARTGILYSQFETPVAFHPEGDGATIYYTMYPSFAPPTLDINGVAQSGSLLSFNYGDQLTFTTPTLPAGTTVYYSLDGTDPRVPGGGINTASDVYKYVVGTTSPITLTASGVIDARVYSGGTWSALCTATLYANLAPGLRVTELMYDPLPATPAEVAAGYSRATPRIPTRTSSTSRLRISPPRRCRWGDYSSAGAFRSAFPSTPPLPFRPVRTWWWSRTWPPSASATVRSSRRSSAAVGRRQIVLGQYTHH